MFRSLRARLLIASMTIAVCAVAATAWLTSRGTSEQLRSDLQNTLEVDSSIYQDLATYASENTSWDGVEELVAELSESTGRRIALTTMDGKVIADSTEPGDVAQAELPKSPAAIVDPVYPRVEFYGAGYDDELNEEELHDEDPYLLTPENVEEASACLDEEGLAHEIVDDGQGLDILPPDDLFDEDADDELLEAEADAWENCVAPDIPEESDEFWDPDELAEFNEQTEAEAECLDRQGVPYLQWTDTDGELMLEPDLADPDTAAVYDFCVEEAVRANSAPRAQLYLGEPDDNGLSLRNAGGGRTLLAAGVVAALAVALTFAASRRVLRPVAALTDAARRMESGDLSHRVNDEGNDEIARLAHAFNSMAGALAADEEQRRRMASDVAHELRTPLANIRGYVEAAQDGVTPSDPAFLGSLHEEAVLLQRLVDDLQVLSLAEAGRLVLHRETVDLSGFVEQTAAAHQMQAEAAGVQLAAEVPSEASVVDLDPVRMRQALSNLVTNAIRHTPPEGSVTIRARTEGTDVVMEVVDTGEGVAPDHLAHVFDRFWRADASRTRDTGGSGLGLAICSQLVEHHGGTITADSILGEGSTFRIRIPAGHYTDASPARPLPPP